MTKLWLGKVGALFRINKKEAVSVTFDTAPLLQFVAVKRNSQVIGWTKYYIMSWNLLSKLLSRAV